MNLENNKQTTSEQKSNTRRVCKQSNLIAREDIRNELLVPLHRLPRPSTKRRAKNAKATTHRQNLPRDHPRHCTHSSSSTPTQKVSPLLPLDPPNKALELPRSRRKSRNRMFSVILNRSPETEESHYYSSNRSNNPQSTTKNHLIQSKSTIKQPRLIELPRIGD